MSDRAFLIFVILVAVILLLTGCAKKEPDVVYKEVFIPTKCQAKMPNKPINKGDFESHKEKMVYYLECERLLKFCIGKK